MADFDDWPASGTETETTILLQHLSGKVGHLGAKVEALDRRYDTLSKDSQKALSILERVSRVDSLKTHMIMKERGFDRVDEWLGHVEARQDAMERDYGSDTEWVERVEAQYVSLSGRFDALDRRVVWLKGWAERVDVRFGAQELTNHISAGSVQDVFETCKRLDGWSKQIDIWRDVVDVWREKVDTRLDGVDQRFDGVDQRFDGVDQRFDGVDKRLDRIDAWRHDVDLWRAGVDSKLDKILVAVGAETSGGESA